MNDEWLIPCGGMGSSNKIILDIKQQHKKYALYLLTFSIGTHILPR